MKDVTFQILLKAKITYELNHVGFLEFDALNLQISVLFTKEIMGRQISILLFARLEPPRDSTG